MIDWTEISTGDDWEFLARDFLSELGFVIDVDPGRGSDAGRDLVVSEQLKGTLFQKKFRWLVSCKHNAKGGSAVGSIEVDITDRCKRNECDGFIGFYSTSASSTLIQRLTDLRSRNEISAYEIFDCKKLESIIHARGMSGLLLRYVPNSYRRMRPISKLFSEYAPLKCSVCEKDLLKDSLSKPYSANILWACEDVDDKRETYKEIHVVCKGACDRLLSDKLFERGMITGWEDVTDLCNPLIYLQNLMAYMNKLQMGEVIISKDAHEKMKEIYLALAQINLRHITKEDEDRYLGLRQISDLMM